MKNDKDLKEKREDIGKACLLLCEVFEKNNVDMEIGVLSCISFVNAYLEMNKKRAMVISYEGTKTYFKIEVDSDNEIKH